MYDETEEILVAVERLSARERKRVSELLFALDEGPGMHVEESSPVHPVLANHEFVSVEDYLAFDDGSRVRHEYVAGCVYAMNGGTRAHARIAGNIFAAMRAHLRGGPCSAYYNGLRTYIKVNDDEFYYYPDVFVACGRGGSSTRIDDAKLIVEVLSPSTQSIDRREKRLNYPHIETLEEFVLVSQRSHEVTFHRRADRWRPFACTSPRDVVEFQSIQLQMPLLQVYESVF